MLAGALEHLRQRIETTMSCDTVNGTKELHASESGFLKIFIVPLSSSQRKVSMDDSNIIKYLTLDILVKTRMGYMEAYQEAEKLMDLLPTFDDSEHIIDIIPFSPEEAELKCSSQTFRIRCQLRANK